jgi:hypothetical protein
MAGCHWVHSLGWRWCVCGASVTLQVACGLVVMAMAGGVKGGMPCCALLWRVVRWRCGLVAHLPHCNSVAGSCRPWLLSSRPQLRTAKGMEAVQA